MATKKTNPRRGKGTAIATGAISMEDLEKVKYEVGQEFGLSDYTGTDKNKKKNKK
ncbi:MAG: hypothetical protein PHT79_00010 [Syntrophomonadaceae bacterium]|nr:hypothetical protein [Syntrophomonadaceae bacterium]MDD4548138.1 hypothetical protein [Syntrophomonadaceae bacterium]